MDTDGRPPGPDTARNGAPPKDFESPKDLERRRRIRNWALLVVLFGLAALFYAITLVKLSKSG
jgi:hypothetical protein